MTVAGYLKCRHCGSVFERNCNDPEVTFFIRWDKCYSCGRRAFYGYFSASQNPEYWMRPHSKLRQFL